METANCSLVESNKHKQLYVVILFTECLASSVAWLWLYTMAMTDGNTPIRKRKEPSDAKAGNQQLDRAGNRRVSDPACLGEDDRARTIFGCGVRSARVWPRGLRSRRRDLRHRAQGSRALCESRRQPFVLRGGSGYLPSQWGCHDHLSKQRFSRPSSLS